MSSEADASKLSEPIAKPSPDARRRLDFPTSRVLAFQVVLQARMNVDHHPRLAWNDSFHRESLIGSTLYVHDQLIQLNRSAPPVAPINGVLPDVGAAKGTSRVE